MTINYVSKVRTAINDDQVVVFNLMITCMSAERQLDLTKMGIDVSSLPSASRKLVQEKIFPKEFLNEYSRLRDRANAVLARGAAVGLNMGTVSSRTEAVAKISDLNDIKAEWAALLDRDSKLYDDICNKRIALIAAEAYKEGVSVQVVNTLVDTLRKRQPTWDDFKSRMNFAYSSIPLKLELDEDKADFDPILFQAQREGIVALREGVFGGLVQYLARESGDILKVLNGKKMYHGVYTINYRTVSRIGAITEKLHGLAFVHQQIRPLATVIDESLGFMPKSVDQDLGMKSGEFLNLVACLEAMSDQHELLARLRDKQPLVVVSQASQLQMVGAIGQGGLTPDRCPASRELRDSYFSFSDCRPNSVVNCCLVGSGRQS
ncbi:DUF3150 domain-containing protein [Pseudomonas syringae pv. actinidiae]|nr:DUF3150 domain-containing protein [Pseudomonas syringae pv. actinidiae]